jgi:hypothetical protein
MVNIEENDRRIKEIEEAGRRQADETLRAREDVLYNEIMRVHQTTVDSYLDWIMKNTLEKGNWEFLILQHLLDRLILWRN